MVETPIDDWLKPIEDLPNIRDFRYSFDRSNSGNYSHAQILFDYVSPTAPELVFNCQVSYQGEEAKTWHVRFDYFDRAPRAEMDNVYCWLSEEFYAPFTEVGDEFVTQIYYKIEAEYVPKLREQIAAKQKERLKTQGKELINNQD